MLLTCYVNEKFTVLESVQSSHIIVVHFVMSIIVVHFLIVDSDMVERRKHPDLIEMDRIRIPDCNPYRLSLEVFA